MSCVRRSCASILICCGCVKAMNATRMVDEGVDIDVDINNQGGEAESS